MWIGPQARDLQRISATSGCWIFIIISLRFYLLSTSATFWRLTFWNLWLLTSVCSDLCLCRVWCPGTFPPMSLWCLPVSVNQRSALGFLMLALIFPDTFHLSTECHIVLELEGQPSSHGDVRLLVTGKEHWLGPLQSSPHNKRHRWSLSRNTRHVPMTILIYCIYFKT